MDKAKQRKARKEDLEALTIKELGDVKPYKKGKVTGIITEEGAPKRLSKSAMIETILTHEGLGRE